MSSEKIAIILRLIWMVSTFLDYYHFWCTNLTVFQDVNKYCASTAKPTHPSTIWSKNSSTHSKKEAENNIKILNETFNMRYRQKDLPPTRSASVPTLNWFNIYRKKNHSHLRTCSSIPPLGNQVTTKLPANGWGHSEWRSHNWPPPLENTPQKPHRNDGTLSPTIVNKVKFVRQRRRLESGDNGVCESREI